MATMTLYVYNTETNEVVARIHGESNDACERVVDAQYGDTDYYGATYSPAFGFADGLVDSDSAVDIEA